jgi:hypothetical protein
VTKGARPFMVLGRALGKGNDTGVREEPGRDEDSRSPGQVSPVSSRKGQRAPPSYSRSGFSSPPVPCLSSTPSSAHLRGQQCVLGMVRTTPRTPPIPGSRARREIT